MRPASSRAGERGVTLVELMIAVSITAVITVGLLFALRTSVAAYETATNRLRANRAQVSRNQILARELGGIMPVVALCGGAQTPSFYGGSDSLRMISSYSIAEGFRGYPQVVEMRVVRASSGGLQLVASEQPYSPGSTGSFCGASGAEFAFGSPAPIVLADDLASCSFSYRPPRNPFGTQESDWAPEWTKGMTLPAAIKVEMKPKQSPGGGLPAMTVTVPVRVDRNLYQGYTD